VNIARLAPSVVAAARADTRLIMAFSVASPVKQIPRSAILRHGPRPAQALPNDTSNEKAGAARDIKEAFNSCRALVHSGLGALNQLALRPPWRGAHRKVVERPGSATRQWAWMRHEIAGWPVCRSRTGVQLEGSSEHRCFLADHVRSRRKRTCGRWRDGFELSSSHVARSSQMWPSSFKALGGGAARPGC
jgi:hypothetical protein